MNRNLRARANRGFTIVELIVVVTVIGFLAASRSALTIRS